MMVIALLLLEFTSPTGKPVYIAPAHIIAVGISTMCTSQAHAVIRTADGHAICVKETIAEIMEKLNR